MQIKHPGAESKGIPLREKSEFQCGLDGGYWTRVQMQLGYQRHERTSSEGHGDRITTRL